MNKFSQTAQKVLRDFSPVLAGFKIALILTGWFGVGSVAKWVVEHWYPFTRWIWDVVALNLNLPPLPVALKDSLTVLVFFLPLGVSALLEIRAKKERDASTSVRLVALILGLLFLLVVSKDAVYEIINGISKSE